MFGTNFRKEVDKIVEEIKQALAKGKKAKMKRTKRIIVKSKWTQLIGELEQLKNDNWKYKRDTSDVEQALKRVEEIHLEFLEDLTGIKKEQQDVKKEGESNELEEFLKLKKPRNINIEIPNNTLPQEGILYEKKGRTYLTIEFVDSINNAKKIGERYKAKIVAERGD